MLFCRNCWKSPPSQREDVTGLTRCNNSAAALYALHYSTVGGCKLAGAFRRFLLKNLGSFNALVYIRCNMRTVNAKRGEVLCILCLIVFAGRLTITQGGIHRWWALGVQQTCAAASTATCPSCSSLGFLTQNQTALCRSHGDGSMVGAISKGTLQAIRDCQNKFSNWRWNCPTFQGENLFGKFIEDDTKERAVLNAYMSAGAAHSIAKACKDNLITGCSCVIQTSTTYKDDVTYLHACGDDVLFAINFLRNFTGSGNSTTPLPAAIDKHNNEVGYKAAENRTQYCRCTGLSGSCTLQTCYLRSPAIEEVGAKLRVKYDGAQPVRGGNGGSLVSINQPTQQLTSGVLVYESQSPDLCEAQPHLGVLGVEGRKCDPNSHGTDGCNIMCCGYGYSEYIRRVPVEDCQFKWCCRIECLLVSNQTVSEYKCNGPPTPTNG